jgi:hypothetical protein
MRKPLALALLAAPLLACSSAAPPTPTLPSTGVVQLQSPAQVMGTDLALAAAFYAPGVDASGNPMVLIWLSSSLQTCASLGSNSQRADTNLLAMQLALNSPNGTPVLPLPGVAYQVVGGTAQQNGGGAYAGVTAFLLDSGCSQQLTPAQSVATSGNLSILNWAGAGAPLAGGLNASIGASGDSFALSFTATYCPALANTATQAPTKCQGGDAAAAQ